MARLLTTLMLIPHVMLIATTGVAMAQVESSSQYVAVIDFSNQSKVGDSMLSRLATDAVWVELTNSDKFSTTTREQMLSAMSDLDLTAPLSLTSVLRIAEKLGVNAVIVGELREVKITDKPRQARVEIVIRMLDASTGEPMNGAVARGASAPRETFTGDDDVLITEAINNAAYVGVRRMLDYIIPEATVLNAVGDSEVLLNRGAQDGIERGMEMIVARQGEVIGKIRIIDVSNNDSRASVISAVRGVRPEDRARAIFKLPEVAAGGYGEPATKITGGIIGGKKKKGGAGQILGILGGLALLIAIAGGHKSSGESGGPSIVAEAGHTPTINPIGGGPGVRITLDPGRWGGGEGLLQWKIWRDDMPFEPILVAGPSEPYILDFVLPRELDYLELDPNSPEEAPEVKDAINNPLPGITVGFHHTYRVSAVLRRITSFGEETNYRYEETVQQSAGLATPLDRLVSDQLTGPVRDSSDVNRQAVSFEFQSVRGADNYIVEVALDPGFNNLRFSSPIVSWSPDTEGDTITIANQDLSSALSGVPTSQNVYWRVGARYSADNPGPVRDPATGKRFIFSEISQFKLADRPPDPPG